MMIRWQMDLETTAQRDAVCSLLATLKRFGLIPIKSRWYVNNGEHPPSVDVIYAS